MKTHALEACPGCGSQDATDEFVGDHRLRRCTSCQLVYAPEYGDPEEIYVSGYLKGESEFGLDLFHPLFQEFLVWAAHRRLDRIEKHTHKGRLLDVGCGSGEVLGAARDRGWEAQGAEPVTESAEIAQQRGLDVRAAMLQDSGLPERSYDVVSAFHVLEHMSDGVAFLQLLARWAKPGGHVVVELPNWDSRHRRVWNRRWNGLRPLEHIGHYGPATVASTARHAGLDPAHVTTYGFPWQKQTVVQALDDVGIMRWRDKITSPLLSRPGNVPDNPGRMLNPLGRGLLRLVHRRLTAKGTNQVVLGILRVP